MEKGQVGRACHAFAARQAQAPGSNIRKGRESMPPDSEPTPHPAPARKVVTDPRALADLTPAWSDLLGRSASNEPMLSPAWLLTWWAVYGEGTGRQLKVALFYEGDRLVGLAPLCRRTYRYRFGIPFRRLEPFGADVDEQDGVCSDYLNVLAERGSERRVCAALAEALRAGDLGPCDEFVMPAMDGENPMPGLLAEAFLKAGYRAECSPTGASPYVTLPATWEGYLSSLPKKKRHNIRYALRDFDAFAGGRAELHCALTPGEMEEARRVLVALHADRWTGSGQAGAFEKPRFSAFHDRVQPLLFRQDALQLLWLSVAGEPLAAMYNLVWDNKVYFYQSGRKVGLPPKLSPGIALIARALQKAIAEGRREFDFLAGASPYKMQFSRVTRPLVQVRAARSCAAEWARRAVERGAGWARRVRDRLKARPGGAS
jgi:CelD/BcsL family acetyltransferase involved in cellulose biosynthesis